MNHYYKSEQTTDHDYREMSGYGISSSWDVRHASKLSSLIYKIRKGNKDKFLELTDLLYSAESNPNTFKPKQVSFEKNIITHPAISLMNKNITGQDRTRFLYVASSTDNSEVPTIYSSKLKGENARMSIEATGFYFASGTTIFQGCVFPTTINDAVIKSFASFTHLDPLDPDQVLFWITRIMDPTKWVYHYKDQTIYLHVHVIDCRSKTSE